MTNGRWIALAMLLLAGCQGADGPPPLVLGHVANQSGPDAAGRRAEQGIRLALKERTDDGLAEALYGRPLHVRHTDTRGQLDAFESQAVRLVDVNRVIGLIGGTTPAEVARIDRAHVPVLAPAGVRPAGVSDMVFAIGMRPSQQAAVLARYAATELDLAGVIVLADERRDEYLALADDFGRAFAQERTKKTKAQAGPVAPIRFGKDANWADLARQIGARKTAQAVVFAGRARDWLEVRRKLRGPALPLIFAGDDGDVAGLQGAPGKQTVYFATAFVADPDTPGTQSFIRHYREAFGPEPPDVAAALGYESLLLYAEALHQAGPLPAAEKLRDALRGIKDLAGIAGTLTMAEDQHVRRALFVARFDGATQTPLRRYAPDALP